MTNPPLQPFDDFLRYMEEEAARTRRRMHKALWCAFVVLLALVATMYSIDANAQPPRLIGADGQYLGTLSTNPYSSDSTSNPYGRYGSEYSPHSINNPYGRYGSPYSPDSPNNPYATGSAPGYDAFDTVGSDF